MIETERLLLRPLELADRDAIFEAFTDAVTRFMTPATPKEPAETEAFLRSSIERRESGKDMTCAVLREGRFIGCVGVHDLDTDLPELGIWIREDAWGNGFGLEAIRALRDWAGAAKYRYPVDEANLPSRRLAEKLGGTVVSGPNFDGKLNLVVYDVPG